LFSTPVFFFFFSFLCPLLSIKVCNLCMSTSSL
jgi:hypothetical protein